MYNLKLCHRSDFATPIQGHCYQTRCASSPLHPYHLAMISEARLSANVTRISASSHRRSSYIRFAQNKLFSLFF